MVDNLPQRRIPRQALAMQPLPGELQVQDGQGGGAIADRNAERYRPYVQAFTRVDPSALAAAYKRFYPLFQQAYEQLGYPDRYFNDRVVEVIDHLLQAPAPA
ncbi:MAG TPA: DUF3014 domain-containing protein, partial [Xanthomonadaceae bacterium]|nr:DUF3014 domain-containing protein [Xanthomonadaceae bacterium]